MSTNTKIAAVGQGLDSRYTMAKGMRRQINKLKKRTRRLAKAV